jgi:hypothetical protein
MMHTVSNNAIDHKLKGNSNEVETNSNYPNFAKENLFKGIIDINKAWK